LFLAVVVLALVQIGSSSPSAATPALSMPSLFKMPLSAVGPHLRDRGYYGRVLVASETADVIDLEQGQRLPGRVVMHQVPAAGTPTTSSRPIVVWVVTLIDVPQLVGLPVGEAVSVAGAASFNLRVIPDVNTPPVQGTRPTIDQCQNYTVSHQVPPNGAGMQLESGSLIGIVITHVTSG
jgi:hypothetical protein